ncbi:hypothetical protein, partial [Escherichia coli]
GRIYGDAVGVSAATFNNLEENGVAATLAGRERVDLGVQTLNKGTSTYYYRIKKKGTDRQGESISPYEPPAVIQTITLKPGELT